MTELLSRAGVTVGGEAAHDIEVHDPRFFARVLRDGALGMGESYMDGWWDSPAPDQMLERIVRGEARARGEGPILGWRPRRWRRGS